MYHDPTNSVSNSVVASEGLLNPFPSHYNHRSLALPIFNSVGSAFVQGGFGFSLQQPAWWYPPQFTQAPWEASYDESYEAPQSNVIKDVELKPSVTGWDTSYSMFYLMYIVLLYKNITSLLTDKVLQMEIVMN